MKHKLSGNSGLSIIATVMLLMLLALFAAVAVSLVTTSANIGVQEEQGVAAFYMAEGGMQYALAKNKLNIPNYSTHGQWYDLGAGEFKVDTPAYLDGDIAIGASTITVKDSTSAFPSSGRITIGSDFGITYLNTDATHFLNASGGQAHNDGDSVYPATQLAATIPADPTCQDRPFINVVEDTGGFDISKPFFIDNEYFLCATKTATQFQTCKRCQHGSSDAAHPTNRYASQYILTSTGRITNILSNNVQRVVKITAGPWEE